jgi:formylglycine-generating enzyme required for sulfatase activity
MQAGGLSAYGTMGQGGNVFEWEETEFDLVNDSGSSARGFRGGGWYGSSGNLSASTRYSDSPTSESLGVGFRVASLDTAAVPEPSSLALLSELGVCGLWRLRRRLC